MKSLSLAAALLLSVVFFAADAEACTTYETPFTTAYRGEANAELNDYSRIFMDADNPNCAQAAMYFLTTKLKNELDSTPPGQPTKLTFQRWLDGYKVAVIFAAAHRLAANGWIGPDLDVQLARLEGRFAHFVGSVGDEDPSGTCGGDELNTCMDDLVGTASGYAWMAAYQARRPHRVADLGAAKRTLAENYLRAALTPVQSSTDRAHGICLRYTPLDGYSYPLCNAPISALHNGTAQTISVNHGRQKIHYGLGLMTSVAVTKMGLEEAGSTFTFNADEVKIARALMEEAQRNMSGTSSYITNNCFSRVGNNLVRGVDCGDGYLPNQYRLKPLYDSYFNGVPGAGTPNLYISNFFDTNLFDIGEPNDPNHPNPHHSYNRYVTYGVLANTWVEWRQNPNLQLPQLMPYDNNPPSGYFEQISSTGYAQGWACDKDKPTGRTFVDFYADGVKVTEVSLTPATSSSEGPINTACNGGSAHRFWVYLPTWTKNKQVTAYSIDYTWARATNIGTRTW
jgi:hypothetical protein